MNIFFLDQDIQKATEYHVDKHVVKMRLEIAQLLCTAHHVLESQIEIPYKPTHKNHPSAIWVRKSVENYNYALELGLSLCVEMRHRFNTPHQKCEVVLNFLKENPIVVENDEGFSMPPIVTSGPYSNIIQTDDAWKYLTDSYQEYYNRDKTHLFKWSNRSTPTWIK